MTHYRQMMRRRENRRAFLGRWQDRVPIRLPDPKHGETLRDYCKRVGLDRYEFAAMCKREHLITVGLWIIPPPSAPGLRRRFIRCERHGMVGFYDFIPYGLSNPISMPMQCGCDAHPRSIFNTPTHTISEIDGLKAIKRQMQERERLKAERFDFARTHKVQQ